MEKRRPRVAPWSRNMVQRKTRAEIQKAYRERQKAKRGTTTEDKAADRLARMKGKRRNQLREHLAFLAWETNVNPEDAILDRIDQERGGA